jgi:predicted CoA-binding protein
MKGEKHEKLDELETKLKDYIGDVESIRSVSEIFTNDKTIIIVACSQSDYNSITKYNKDNEFIIIKANPICEVYPQK